MVVRWQFKKQLQHLQFLHLPPKFRVIHYSDVFHSHFVAKLFTTFRGYRESKKKKRTEGGFIMCWPLIKACCFIFGLEIWNDICCLLSMFSICRPLTKTLVHICWWDLILANSATSPGLLNIIPLNHTYREKLTFWRQAEPHQIINTQRQTLWCCWW